MYRYLITKPEEPKKSNVGSTILKVILVLGSLAAIATAAYFLIKKYKESVYGGFCDCCDDDYDDLFLDDEDECCCCDCGDEADDECACCCGCNDEVEVEITEEAEAAEEAEEKTE